MKSLLFSLPLLLMGFASASPLTLTLTGPDPKDVVNPNGFYTGPYDFTTNFGPPLQLVCDDIVHEINDGDSWQVTILSGSDYADARFPTGDYPTAFVLVQEIMEADPSQYVDLHQELWHAMAPTLAPLNNPTEIAGFNSALAAGALLTVTQLDMFDIYVPTNPSEGQEQIGMVPEPRSILLIATGLGIIVARRQRQRRMRLI